nr:MAG TPA: hypothetical protein [Caudoviricetes sp.]
MHTHGILVLHIGCNYFNPHQHLSMTFIDI